MTKECLRYSRREFIQKLLTTTGLTLLSLSGCSLPTGEEVSEVLKEFDDWGKQQRKKRSTQAIAIDPIKPPPVHPVEKSLIMPSQPLERVPYFSQRNAAFQNEVACSVGKECCAASEACGRTCLAMILAWQGLIPNTETAAEKIINYRCGKSSANTLQEIAKAHGLTLRLRGVFDNLDKVRTFMQEQEQPVAIALYENHMNLIVGWIGEIVFIHEPYPSSCYLDGCREGTNLLVHEQDFWEKFDKGRRCLLVPVLDKK